MFNKDHYRTYGNYQLNLSIKEKVEKMNNEFQCAVCEEEFICGWSDEEAIDEYKEIFPGMENEEKVLVCDDCFNQVKWKY